MVLNLKGMASIFILIVAFLLTGMSYEVDEQATVDVATKTEAVQYVEPGVKLESSHLEVPLCGCPHIIMSCGCVRL